MKDSTSHEDADNHISYENCAIPKDDSSTEDNHEEPDRAELHELKDVFARFF